MSEKLQKVLAQVGLGSRRELEKWIEAGRVQVNGKVATLGDRVESRDDIKIDGQPIKMPDRRDRIRLVVYNKPEGEVSTKDDPEGRPTVFQHLPILRHGRWVMVGRLDINTAGLLLFTNSGELANLLMHPSQQVEREYLVRIHGVVDDEMLKRLKEGVMLEDGPARFLKIKVGQGGNTNRWFSVVIAEGRNREVRRLWESQGVEVSRLKRIRYGTVEIPSYVRSGEWLELPPADVRKLCKTMGLKTQADWSLTPQEKHTLARQERKLRGRGAQ
ncbi:MAG: 23S rRNA pseudouridylate synthase B [Porticoccaceae bacterium]|nr:23S rRNA pseudouridylate synthase B [Porticoccaceae bacterium]